MKTPAARLSRALIGSATAAAFTISAHGVTPPPPPPPPCPNSVLVLEQGTLSAAWATSRDLGSRLYRNRAGIVPGMHDSVAPAPATGSKGGMGSAKDAKGIAVPAPVPNRWEVFGSLFYYTEDRDRLRCESKNISPKPVLGSTQTVSGDTSLEVFGGSVGTEYHINRDWSAGFAVSASKGNLKLGIPGSSHIDSVVLSPYISYYHANAIGSADLWADLTYGYGMHALDTRRFTGSGYATGSPDARTHQLEFQTGLNFGGQSFKHGPFAGVRWTTGSINSFTEAGPGGSAVPELDFHSLVSILGYQVSYRQRQGNGYWVPQLRASWEHELNGRGSTLAGQSLSLNSGDKDLAVLGAGIGYWWDNGWSVALEYEFRFDSNTQGQYGALTVGKEF